MPTRRRGSKIGELLDEVEAEGDAEDEDDDEDEGRPKRELLDGDDGSTPPNLCRSDAIEGSCEVDDDPAEDDDADEPDALPVEVED